MLKKAWDDPVWSKVIASVILAVGTLLITYFLNWWPAIGRFAQLNEDKTDPEVRKPIEPPASKAPKSQSAVSQTPSISQHSEGANSPIIMGDRNVFNFNATNEAKLDEIIAALRQRGYDDPSKLRQKYPLGYTIFELTNMGQLATQYTPPDEGFSVLNNYEKVDWREAQVIQNTKDRIALRLPDLKRKDGTGVITGLSTGGPKKVGLLACGVSRTETEGVGLCGEILAIREDGVVFLVNLMQFPPLSK
jgi:hypothetical protein